VTASPSRADVERRLLERGGATARIPRLPAGEPAPLSFAQERMWLLDQLLPDVTAYNVPRLLRYEGRLDEDALRRALDTVCSRHSALRTGIALVDGQPVQQVHDDRRIELTVADLRDREGGQAEAEAMISEAAWRRFDLERDAMVRALLLHLDEHDLLLLVSHHLVSDHGSAHVLLTELAAAYDAARSGRTPTLPELPIQYSDFAAWQRRRISGPTLEGLAAHWEEQLAGAPERFDLPFDKPRPPAKTYAGSELRGSLPAALADTLRALARQHGVSFFTVLLAGFYSLLHRYTGEDDIVVGTPITGRHHEETQRLIGYFSNTLALRVVLEDDMPFAALLARVRKTTLDAFAHQELPFERLVEALNPQRDPSHTPVFQVLFTHDLPSAPVELDAKPLDQLPLPRWPWSRFDLALGAHEREDGALDLVVEYSADLFEAETIRRLFGHFESLLAAAAADPDAPLGKLSLVTEPERRELVEQWNRTERPIPDGCLHDLVGEQAARVPERAAVVGSGEALTYRELAERSDDLARHLRNLGVGEGALVGVCVERVPATMVALLGVLKTGAAYVPIEPTYPMERKAFMLSDAEAPVVITQESLLEQLPEHGGRTVCLDRDRAEIASSPSAQLPTADPDAIAYVIYTSGSTGQPKGVEIRHRSVVNLLAAMREQPGLSEDDVVVNVTTPAFDLSVPDLYLPLVCGAKLVIAPREDTQDPARLATLLEEVGATLVQATPTTWRMLVDAGWEGDGKLKIVCGGEALPRGLANDLVDRGAELWHMYGPTETTVWSSARELGRGHGSPPIGGPIANTRFYVVDSRLQPVPVGVPGELLIGGAGVARGYRGRAQLTAERFFDDPLAPGSGRVYRTGDRMRLRPDGTLEFLGRLDHQVKLRGYRIELGEIEAALDAHPDVLQSVALIHEDDSGEKQLVAYVVAEDGREPAVVDLRAHVAAAVPGYAVPSAIVSLDELPTTANGKLDVQALPRPGLSRAGLDTRFVAPRTPTEQAIAAIWTDLLPVDRVGAEDDFFALGGHSLLAVKMLARVHDQLGVEIFLTTVFERPTLAALAEEVAGRIVAEAAGDELEQLLADLEAES
jgi:amino acid adenylation domain-containing protein